MSVTPPCSLSGVWQLAQASHGELLELATFVLQLGDATAERLAQLASAEGHHDLAAEAAGNLGELHVRWGRLDEAERWARESVAHAEESGLPGYRTGMLGVLGNVLHFRGRLAEAQSLFLQAGASMRGAACTECGWLSRESGTGDCPVCAGAMRQVPDLLDAMAQAVRSAGGAVQNILAETPLAAHQVGADLRFKVTATV